jgi:hypothetical protein
VKLLFCLIFLFLTMKVGELSSPFSYICSFFHIFIDTILVKHRKRHSCMDGRTSILPAFQCIPMWYSEESFREIFNLQISAQCHLLWKAFPTP